MSEYNQVQEEYRDKSKDRITRQLKYSEPERKGGGGGGGGGEERKLTSEEKGKIGKREREREIEGEGGMGVFLFPDSRLESERKF